MIFTLWSGGAVILNNIMKHHFAYKLVEIIDGKTLQDLKDCVIRQKYCVTKDFESYAIQVTDPLDPAMIPAIGDFFEKYMFKYFDRQGNIQTNVAKMFPQSYVAEHSDYGGNYFGKLQNDIIKFHIPIITNSSCGLMWTATDEDASTACCALEEGGIYIMDNVRTHSSVNFSLSDRYWLTARWKASSLLDKSILD